MAFDGFWVGALLGFGGATVLYVFVPAVYAAVLKLAGK